MYLFFFNCVHTTVQPPLSIYRSVGRLVRQSVNNALLFFRHFTAPAHPHVPIFFKLRARDCTTHFDRLSVGRSINQTVGPSVRQSVINA